MLITSRLVSLDEGILAGGVQRKLFSPLQSRFPRPALGVSRTLQCVARIRGAGVWYWISDLALRSIPFLYAPYPVRTGRWPEGIYKPAQGTPQAFALPGVGLVPYALW